MEVLLNATVFISGRPMQDLLKW